MLEFLARILLLSWQPILLCPLASAPNVGSGAEIGEAKGLQHHLVGPNSQI